MSTVVGAHANSSSSQSSKSLYYEHPRFIYHLAESKLWNEAKNQNNNKKQVPPTKKDDNTTDEEINYFPPTYQHDGFIHCCGDPSTILEIANHFCQGIVGDFVVLKIDCLKLRPASSGSTTSLTPVVWESPMSVGNTEAHVAVTTTTTTTTKDAGPLFPHIYGPINTHAVTEEWNVHRDGKRFIAIDHVPVIEAVLFDCDGTLIDSEPLWHRAELEIFRDHLGMVRTTTQ